MENAVLRTKGRLSKAVPEDYGPPGVKLRSSPFVFGLLAAAGAIVAIVGFAGVRRAGLVLAMLVAAGFIAIGLDRPVSALVRRGMRRVNAVGLIALAGLVVLIAAVAAGLPALANQADHFFAELPQTVDRAVANGRLGWIADPTGIADEIKQHVTRQNVVTAATGLLSGLVSVIGLLVALGTTAILTLFLLVDLDRLKRGMLRLIVASRRERVSRLTDAVQGKVGGYLSGAVTVAAFAGTAALLWSVIFGVPYPLIVAMLVTFFDLIPQIGATIGSTIGIAMALSSSLGLALATLLFFCVYQAVENWIVYPRLMGRAVRITNLAAIVSAMLGWALFGVLGVLIAVPAYASLQLIVREVVFPRQDAR